MARPRSSKVHQVKARLLARIADGLHRPGDRFMSNRAIARQFVVSYQTADRLVRELCAEGKLVRRSRSGTYVPGKRRTRIGAQLIFHPRAKRMGSFGARLLAELIVRLDQQHVAWTITWAEDRRPVRLLRDYFPVIWESSQDLSVCVKQKHPALLLNQPSPAGLAAVHLESISVDDFGGGVSAAQLLAQLCEIDPALLAAPRAHRGRNSNDPAHRFAVLSGPADDPRSQERVRGFLSILPATVVPAQSWFFEGAIAEAPQVVKAGADGIFCCNDRLAQAVRDWCHHHKISPPPLVGFDDAPIAEQISLTTIAIPWREMTAAAADVIQQWLDDAPITASRRIFAPRPVVRWRWVVR
ncbi:MAG: substrate-binding domain-containing protein [Phycisphaerales bacterium]|nr:substrate-binding domain-containing protein [Phycisphaerales bacterium]